MSRLEDARRFLVAGDFLAAEDQYWQARLEWEGSRIRAPLLEKGVDPLLRLGGKLFGRDGQRSVLTSFGEKAEALSKDLEDVAALHLKKTDEKLDAAWDSLSRDDVEAIALALRMERESQIFELQPPQLWPATRSYLSGCQRNGLRLDAELLPQSLQLSAEELAWLVQWGSESGPSAEGDVRAVSAWLLALFDRHRDFDLAKDGPCLALSARLAALDPQGAPRALRYARDALAAQVSPEDSAATLRLATALAANEDRLACPGFDPALFHELGAAARRLQIPWPPAEVEELLVRRRSEELSTGIAVAWEDGERRRFLMLRLVADRPADVLVIEIDEHDEHEEQSEAQHGAFRLGLSAARRRIDTLAHPSASVLAPSCPPAWLEGLLAGRQCLSIEALEGFLEREESVPPPAAPLAPHPVFRQEDALSLQWSGLLQKATWLLPRLRALCHDPCFHEEWGRENLRRLGAAGVAVCASLAQALDRIAREDVAAPRLADWPGPLQLRMPPLSERSQRPGAAADLGSMQTSGDHLVLERPSVEELAGWAMAAVPCQLRVDGRERAIEVARALSSGLDPRSVALRPRRLLCAEAPLRLLERWVDESLADLHRGLDVLWLYQVLATAPEADLGPAVVAAGREVARREFGEMLENASESCGPKCRHRRAGLPCFREQMDERRSASLVWIEELDTPLRVEAGRALLVDDFLPRSAELSEDALLGELSALCARLSEPSRVVLWLDVGCFHGAVVEVLPELFTVRPSLRLRRPRRARPLRLHLVDDGYRPGSTLLAEEAAALTRARISRLADRKGRQLLWQPPGVEFPAPPNLVECRGVAEKASAQTVIVPSLGPGVELPGALMLLRLAAAASHTEADLACFDPRAASARRWVELSEGGLEQWRPSRTHSPPPYALLDEQPARSLPRWQSPVDLHRLLLVEELFGAVRLLREDRREVVSELLASVRRHARLALGGLRDDERLLVAALIARLAKESADGGPLQVRTVVWLDPDRDPSQMIGRALGVRYVRLLPGGDSPLEESLLEIDRGHVHWLQLDPVLLKDPAVERWARRQPHLLWFVPQGERWLVGHPGACEEWAGQLLRLRSIFEDSGAACLACSDESGEWLERVSTALALQSRAIHTSRAEVEEGWTLRRQALDDPLLRCSHCSFESKVAHPYHACPSCGSDRLQSPESRASVEVILAQSAAEWIKGLGPQEACLFLSASPDEARQLRKMLGVGPREGAADSLFDGDSPGACFAQRICSFVELYEGFGPPAECILGELPRSAAWLRALRARLVAAGWPAGAIRFLDHPLRWSEGRRDASGVRWGHQPELHEPRWGATRAEIEFRYAQAAKLLAEAFTAAGQSTIERAHGLGPPGPAAETGESFQPASDPEGVRLQRVLRAIEVAGLPFGGETGVARIQVCVDRPSEVGALRWLVEERLLLAQISAAGDEPAEVRAEDRAWRDLLRSIDGDAAVEIPSPVEAADGEESPAAEAMEPGWILGVPGSGRSRLLLNSARAAHTGTRRALVLLPHKAGLLRWAQLQGHRPEQSVEIATVEELALAFLRRHHRLGGLLRAPRLLPSEQSAEGLRVRSDLLREISRRYSASAGELPPVEISDLRLLLEGRAPRGGAAQAFEAAAGGASASKFPVDAALIQRCAEEARSEAGWITRRELRAHAREWLRMHPFVAEGWRQRYGAVLFDDVHAFHSDDLAFADRLFPQARRWFAADPFLLEEHRIPAKPSLRLESGRLPRDFIRAIHALEIDGGGRWHARSGRRGRGTVERMKVLNLEACAALLEERAAAGLHDESRNAILVSHQGDLHRLATRLREGGLALRVGRESTRYALRGPRELLACLCLIQALESGQSGDRLGSLARVLVEAEGLWVDSMSEHELARRLLSWRHGVSTAPRSMSECHLSLLLDLQRRLAGIWTLREAAEAIAASGILAKLLESDAATGRIGQYLEADGDEAWRSIPARVEIEILVDPLRPGPHLWLLRTDEAAGLEFDRVYALCSGHEAPEHHYAALSRCRETFTVLYSEADPFADRL